MTDRRALWINLTLAALVLAVFVQVYDFQFLEYDDSVYCSKNPRIQASVTPEGLLEILTHGHHQLWIPLTSLTYMIGCSLYGLSEAGHHLTNLALHWANVLLLFYVLRRMTGRIGASALVAALFAVHPINVEAVAWVSGRKELLYTLFWLLTVGAYTRYAHRPNVRLYMAVLVLHILGLASKSSQVTLPVILLLLDYWPLNRGTPSDITSQEGRVKLGKLLLEKLPLLVVSVPVAASAVIITRHAGGEVSMTDLPLWTRIGNTPVVYLFYIGKLFFPVGLAPHYSYPIEGYPQWQVAGSALVPIVITLGVLALARRAPYLLVGWLWYLIALLPVCGVVRAANFLTADRYAYVPLIGLFIMLAWLAASCASHVPKLRTPIGGLAIIIVLVLAIGSGRQTRHWRNDITLWEHAVAVVPDDTIAYNNLGTALRAAGRKEEALRVFNQARELHAVFKRDVYMNLGTLLADQGRFEEAEQHFAAVVRAVPDDTVARVYLARVLTDLGRTPEAIMQYNQALILEPDNVEVREALVELSVGKPDRVGAHKALAQSYAVIGNFDEAIRYSEEALNIDPNDSRIHNDLGVIWLMAGSLEKAKSAFIQALKLDPKNTEALLNLGSLLSEEGKTSEAIRHIEQVLQTNPNNAAAQTMLEEIRRKNPVGGK